MTKERIICAAVRHDKKVWMGHRHSHALTAMKDQLSYTMNRNEMFDAQVGREQGFVTSTGRYVNRKEAGKIAQKAGQIKKGSHFCEGAELHSEDIY